MNNRTEAKLTDLSGMQKAIEEILKQAWERGRKYGQNEDRPQGEWKRNVDNVGFISHICSECGAEIELEDCSDDKFCFNCGAKMKGEHI